MAHTCVQSVILGPHSGLTVRRTVLRGLVHWLGPRDFVTACRFLPCTEQGPVAL